MIIVFRGMFAGQVIMGCPLYAAKFGLGVGGGFFPPVGGKAGEWLIRARRRGHR